jgi:hypothetical protein
MPEQKLEIPDKIDILKFFRSAQHNELMYRRERAYKIFTWSSNILLALIGALLITKQSESPFFAVYGIWGKVIVSGAVLTIVAYTIYWQTENRRWHKQNSRIMARIDNIFRLYDENYYTSGDNSTILPKELKGWGSETVNLRTQLFSTNYASATALIGVLAILMIWLY